MTESTHRRDWLLESELVADEALSALRSSSLSLGGVLGQAGVRARIRGNDVVLSYSRPSVGNSWRPLFAGRVEAAPQGSRIRGRFRISRPVAAFMTFWFGFIVLWIIGTAIAAIVTAIDGGGDSGIYFMPFAGIGMAAAGYVMTRFGRPGMGERDEREILAHLERCCQANVAVRPEPGATAAAWTAIFARPTRWVDRFAEVFKAEVFLRLVTTPLGWLVIVCTTACQLPAMLAFTRQASANGAVVGAWVIGVAATLLGLVSLAMLAERRRSAVLTVAAVQLAVLAPLGIYTLIRT